MQKYRLFLSGLVVFIALCGAALIAAPRGDLVHPIYYEKETLDGLSEARADLNQGRIQRRASIALGLMIRLGCYHLKQKGFDEQADKILKEWQEQYREMVFTFPVDLGDHEPISKWLSATYIIFETYLGKEFVRVLKLDHLYIMNHAIPVVFHPCSPPWNNKKEYANHYVPFSKVVVYWSVFGACVGFSSWMGFPICSPIGSVSETIFGWTLAKPLSNFTFSLFCGGDNLSP